MTNSGTAHTSSTDSPTSEQWARGKGCRLPCAAAIRRTAFAMFALLLGVGPFQLIAQKRYPIFTEQDLVKTMKTVGPNVERANTSIAAGDFATAKAQLTRAREQLAMTATFWRDHRKDDAVRMLRETLSRMDELDLALSREKVDAGRARALFGEVDASCQGCHAVYREQDSTTKIYRVKPGSV